MALLVEGGKVVDVREGAEAPADWMILESGILARPEDMHAATISDDCDKLDATNLFLVPGLIDAHVHLGRPRQPSAGSDHPAIGRQVAQSAERTVRAGVTLVRDLGDRWPHGLEAIKAARALEELRVVSALSGISAPKGYGGFLGEVVHDTAELLSAIRRYHDAGAGLIKLYLTGSVDFASGTVGPILFDERIVSTAARAAHDLGLPLAVHANGAEGVMAATAAGADTIEHGILASHDCLRAMADRGIYWVPTLTPLWRALQAGENNADEDGLARTTPLRRVFEQHRESMARAFDLGVKVIAGTDAGAPGVPHGCLIDEVELFVAAGVRPTLALRSATIWAAEALGVEDEAGILKPGRRGDMLLLRRDPLQDSAALREISQVVCGGKIIAPNPGPDSSPPKD